MTPFSTRMFAGLCAAVLTFTLVTVAVLHGVALLTPPAEAQATPVDSGVVPGQEPTITTRWSSRSMFTGEKESVSGRVPTSSVRGVELQQKLPSGWLTVQRSTTDTQGRYRLPLSTHWTYVGKLRVLAPTTADARAEVSRPAPVSVELPYEPRGSASSWAPLFEGERVRFNPCEPVPYRVNFTHAPKGALPTLERALTRVTEATGLTFSYAGSTKVTPKFSATSVEGPAGIVVAWGRIPEKKNAEAFARPLRTPYGWDAQGSTRIIESAEVLISTDYTHTPQQLEELLMHEVGHAIGLDHDPHAPFLLMGSSESFRVEQVMSPVGTVSDLRWGAGDLAGLRTVGLAAGCASLYQSDFPTY